MWELVLGLSLLLMAALWIAAYLCSRKQAKGGRQLVFLIGTLIVWPASTAALFALLGEVILADVGKPVVGLGVIFAWVVAGGTTIVTWLIGYWAASVIGWWMRRKEVGA